jgi:uncharacterized damage-inducible protein DinB
VEQSLDFRASIAPKRVFAEDALTGAETLVKCPLDFSKCAVRRNHVPELAAIVTDTLAGYYEEVLDKIHEWVTPISTEQLWQKPFPYGNSIGHLLLHLTGNLNHYIGKQIAGTGYVRNRPLEFSDTSKRAKEDVLADFDRSIAMVAATIRRQSAEDLVAAYSDPTEPRSKDRFSVFLRMAAHAYHHTGQIVYLAKELSKPA